MHTDMQMSFIQELLDFCGFVMWPWNSRRPDPESHTGQLGLSRFLKVVAFFTFLERKRGGNVCWIKSKVNIDLLEI